MAETKKAKKHIVVFQDEEGNVLKTSFVSHEEAALPPEMPEKRGESVHHEIKFQGWDKDISSVKENLVVKAVYKEVPKDSSLQAGGNTALSPAKTADRGVLLHI